MINVHHHAGASGAVVGMPELLYMRVNATELLDTDVDGSGHYSTYMHYSTLSMR